jgi:hypothetical protein
MHIRILLAATSAGALVAGASAITLPVAHADTGIDAAQAGAPVVWGDSTVAAATTVPSDLTAPVTDIAVNAWSTAAVTADGHLRIWGDPTTDVEKKAPANVTDASAIALNGTLALLLHKDGTVTGWGAGADIATGAAGVHAKAIALNAGTAYAVTTAGRLQTWGATPANPVPARVSDLTDLVDVSVGTFGGLALRADHTAVAWGADLTEALGSDPFNTVPDLGTHKVDQIAVGGLTNGVILDDGSIAVWGLVPDGQPTFNGKVKSLSFTNAAAAVVEDATGHRSVELWGDDPQYPSLTDQARELDLAGQPVAAVVMGENHAAAIVTSFRDLTKPAITGNAIIGQTLTATDATFSLTPTEAPTGQWLATKGGETTAIPNATTNTLEVTEALAGATLTYATTGHYDDQTVVSTSEPTAAVTARASSKITLTVAPARGAFGTARTVTATVTAGANAAAGSVTFASGALTATKTLAAGKATWTLPTSLTVGGHTVTATYAGNTATLGSNASTQVAITKIAPTLTVKAKASGKTTKLAKKVRVTVTVRGLAHVSGSGKVTIIFKGKTTKKVVAKVNSQGIATANLKKIKRGRYTVSVAYAPTNAVVASGSLKTKVKI